MSKEKDSFPYFEPDNYHGWFIQFKSYCRGIGAHLALKPHPTHPIDANGNPQVLNVAQTRALAKLQETWDEHDHKAFSALMKACIRDDKTKKLTETPEDFEHALPLLTRLEERYLSDAERQKGVAWSQFFNFTAQSTESAMDLVSRFDGIVRQLENLGEPVTPAQLYHRFLEASLQSKGTHHQLLATAIYSNPAPLTYDQMKVRFEKALYSTHLGPRHHPQGTPPRSTMLALVAPPPPPLTPMGATIRNSPRRKSIHLVMIPEKDAPFAVSKGMLPKGVTFVRRSMNLFSGTSAMSTRTVEAASPRKPRLATAMSFHATL
jgi:hypothetical protein